MIRSLASHALTACVCIPATVAVAPHVRHALHHAPPVHRAVHHTSPAKPVVQYIFERCAPIALPDADLATTSADIEGLPLIPKPPRQSVIAYLFGPVRPVSPWVVAGPRSAVPEPATWGLMVVGFGMAGGAMRGRKSEIKGANS